MNQLLHKSATRILFFKQQTAAKRKFFHNEILYRCFSNTSWKNIAIQIDLVLHYDIHKPYVLDHIPKLFLTWSHIKSSNTFSLDIVKKRKTSYNRNWNNTRCIEECNKPIAANSILRLPGGNVVNNQQKYASEKPS